MHEASLIVALFKNDCLFLHGYLANLIPILQQFLLVLQERMVYRNARDFFNLCKGQDIRFILSHIFPEWIVFTHASPLHT